LAEGDADARMRFCRASFHGMASFVIDRHLPAEPFELMLERTIDSVLREWQGGEVGLRLRTAAAPAPAGSASAPARPCLARAGLMRAIGFPGPTLIVSPGFAPILAGNDRRVRPSLSGRCKGFP
jgi:hypothetical protein